VNTSWLGDTTPNAVFELVTGKVTLAVGALDNLTVKLELPPFELVVSFVSGLSLLLRFYF
jgi:hypothetical protein